jgi:hypothetical protein
LTLDRIDQDVRPTSPLRVLAGKTAGKQVMTTLNLYC